MANTNKAGTRYKVKDKNNFLEPFTFYLESDIYDRTLRFTLSFKRFWWRIVTDRISAASTSAGVTSLALTDHDTTAGLPEAQLCATATGIKLIPALNFLPTGKINVFISWVGYWSSLCAIGWSYHNLQSTRLERAEKISLKLEKKRIPGVWSSQKGCWWRHDYAHPFCRFSAVTKPCVYPARSIWSLSGKRQVCLCINFLGWTWVSDQLDYGAGGVAVLAHPLRYKLTANWMKRLLLFLRMLAVRE